MSIIFKPPISKLPIIVFLNGQKKTIKALGVYFGNNKEECEKLNWENKIDKMNTIKKKYCHRVLAKNVTH
jgi:hypothetical protein